MTLRNARCNDKDSIYELGLSVLVTKFKYKVNHETILHISFNIEKAERCQS